MEEWICNVLARVHTLAPATLSLSLYFLCLGVWFKILQRTKVDHGMSRTASTANTAFSINHQGEGQCEPQTGATVGMISLAVAAPGGTPWRVEVCDVSIIRLIGLVWCERAWAGGGGQTAGTRKGTAKLVFNPLSCLS